MKSEIEDAGLESKQGAATAEQLSFAAYVAARPEIGLGKMLRNLALEPQDPFKRDRPRAFRRGFVIVVLFSAVFVAWFVWFNVIR
jgi:hypothetical protein